MDIILSQYGEVLTTIKLDRQTLDTTRLNFIDYKCYVTKNTDLIQEICVSDAAILKSKKDNNIKEVATLDTTT